MKILVVSDSFVPTHLFKKGLASLIPEHQIRFIELDMEAFFTPTTSSERSIIEYAGNPQQLVDALEDEEVLLVHGAPVTDAVLDASPNLKVVGVARGGPVNIDLAAASARNVQVITAPARNAEAVADLTLAFMIMLSRSILTGITYIANGGRVGESAFEGAEFFGHELHGHVLGLVGYGNIGARVARRAQAFGMSIVVNDPYVSPEQLEGSDSKMCDLDTLLGQSDFVSLHARATAETVNLIAAKQFAVMKHGSLFINTARETLVDEQALYEALTSQHIAGAALDVLRPWPQDAPSPLLSLPNVIITPHIGGATYEAAVRGVHILAKQIAEHQRGQPMQHVVRQKAGGAT